MQLLPDSLIISAGDLTGYFECRHLTRLDLAYARGDRSLMPGDGADTERLFAKGIEHEERYLQSLKDEGLEVVEIGETDRTLEALEAATRTTDDAMRAGARAIYQAAFLRGGLRGHADFLFRVDRRSRLGSWSYEVADTKLSRVPKPYALLQLCFYSELLQAAQGGDGPELAHVILGTGERVSFRLAEFSAYFRRLRGDLLAELETDAWDTYPVPVAHCKVCRWRESCDDRRENDDHLSLVAGIKRGEIRSLRRAGISKLDALGLSAPGLVIEGIGPERLGKVRAQAAIQLAGRDSGRHELERLEPQAGKGFALLPRPSRGDVFFDFEGYPYWTSDPDEDPYSQEKLEYLFGWVVIEEGQPCYEELWALDRDQEKAALERFIDVVGERRADDPGMHVYHYASYEVTALERLAWVHGTRGGEVERLIGEGVFVDLLPVVTQSMRISEPGYGLKKVELFYGDARETPVTDAADSILEFDRWLQTGDPDILRRIADYNRGDCVSTWMLRDWLLGQREEAQRESEAQIEWFERPTSEAEKAGVVAAQDAELAARLLADLPPNPESKATGPARWRWLLGELLKKPDAPRPFCAVRAQGARLERLDPGREGVRRLAGALAGAQPEDFHPAADQILRGEARPEGLPAPIDDGRESLEGLREVVGALDGGCLVVQGPARSGKTRRGAGLVAELVGARLAVGVAAPTGEGVDRLLAGIAGASARAILSGGADGNDEVRGSGAGSLDLLVIDDAERVSLADALALATSARNVLLLGDPQRSADMVRASGPRAARLSVLRHLLGDRRTVPGDRGVFVGEASGLDPGVAGFLSEVMYDGRLRIAEPSRAHRVKIDGPLNGCGLRWLAVEHEGSSRDSPREADAIATAIAALLDGGSYLAPDGALRELRPRDILALTPYDEQAQCLGERLPDGVRVETVKGAGCEPGAVVFFSLAASGGERDRAQGFGYSDRLLNAAISRADCLAVLVLDPRLLEIHARSLEEMRMLNALCRFVELATPVSAGSSAGGAR